MSNSTAGGPGAALDCLKNVWTCSGGAGVATHFSQFSVLTWLTDWKAVLGSAFLLLAVLWQAWKLYQQKDRGSFLQLADGIKVGSRSFEDEEDTSSRALIKLGSLSAIDLCILAGVEQDRVVTLNVCFIFLILRGVYYLIHYTRVRKSKHYFKERAHLKEIEVRGAYQDLGISHLRAAFIFGAQTMLMLYYLWDLKNNIVIDETAVLFWASAIPIQFMISENMSKDYSLEREFWDYLLTKVKPAKTTLVEKPVGRKFDCPTRPQLWLRCIYSLVSHHVYFYTILCTIPLQLMASDSGMSFATNSFAIVFIPGLDTYEGTKTYGVQMQMLPLLSTHSHS